MVPDALLVVDDNADNLFILTQVVEELVPECNCITTQSPLEALEIARNQPLLGALIDVQMPEMDGIELCRNLKDDPLAGNFPLILITAHHSTSSRKAEGLEAGADDFITRPIDNIELAARLKVMLRIRAAEMALQRELDLGRTRVALSTAMLEGADLQTLSQKLLMAIQRLTKSRHGYVAGYEERGGEVWIKAGTGLAGRLSDENLSGEALRALLNLKEPLITEGPDTNPLHALFSDLPDAERFLSIPLKDGQRILGQVAVAGGLSPYSEKLLQGLLPLVEVLEQAFYRYRQKEKSERLKTLLQEKIKMEALGTLAGGIAHDFNNILLAISGYSELIMAQQAPNSECLDYLEEVFHGVERATTLVDQILAYGRPKLAKREVVEVRSLVEEALGLLRPSFPSSIQIQTRLGNQELYVLGDASQLHQVIVNLGTNAFQAMEEKGDLLEISLEIVEGRREADVPGDLNADKDHLCLKIRDNGCGISDRVRERLFDPYFTTKALGKGSGLGLAVVQGIVKEHAGLVQVKSVEGEGACFELFLPLTNPPDVSPWKEATSSARGGEHILLVDDEAALVRMWRLTLERRGFQVTPFSSSREAREHLSRPDTCFDLLLTDQTMPEFSGLELAQIVQEFHPGKPVVIITGYSKNLTPENLADAGVTEVVRKPISGQRLAGVLRRVLDKRV